jgi:hypothetical protein
VVPGLRWEVVLAGAAAAVIQPRPNAMSCSWQKARISGWARPRFGRACWGTGDADVGVQVLVVGVAVVTVVLADPPVEAHPDPQVGVQEADQVIGQPGAEDPPVAGVVADEGELVNTAAR